MTCACQADPEGAGLVSVCRVHDEWARQRYASHTATIRIETTMGTLAASPALPGAMTMTTANGMPPMPGRPRKAFPGGYRRARGA